MSNWFQDMNELVANSAYELSTLKKASETLQEDMRRQEQERIDRQNAPLLKAMEQQTNALREQVDLLKKDVELAQQREAKAEKEAKHAKMTAWVSIAVAVVSIVVSVILYVL